ncbi:hypothetical protein MASR2M78_06120 [Treponema sp.]
MVILDKDRFEAFLSASLIKAAELSLVEEAEATQSYLEKLIRVRSYLLQEGRSLSLAKELSVLSDYVRLLNVRYAGRFSISFPDEGSTTCLYTQSGQILQAFDRLFAQFVDGSDVSAVSEFFLSISDKVEAELSPIFILSVTRETLQQRIEICLSQS